MRGVTQIFSVLEEDIDVVQRDCLSHMARFVIAEFYFIIIFDLFEFEKSANFKITDGIQDEKTKK